MLKDCIRTMTRENFTYRSYPTLLRLVEFGTIGKMHGSYNTF